uniref:Centromere protein J n=1 Tax=Xiphophorus couchianus TaxID=32473 RepID=A0A3B5ML73_9TELE
MSSPSELQNLSADFFTKWMPSSTRAGVILSPPPELAGSLRHIAAAVPAPLHPDDSFVSDFAPLPASTDSSCLGVDGCGEGTRPVSYLRPAPQGVSDGHLENLGGMTSKTQDLPLMMKLEEQQMHFNTSLLYMSFQMSRISNNYATACPSWLFSRPIKPGIGGQKKTFEELLEEQLRLEEQRLKHEAAFPARRPFLKRGQGLSRFTSSSRASAQKAKDRKEQKPQAITRSNSAPGSILKGSSSAGPPLPVQRKTAVLNKENRGRGLRSPPQDVRAARTTTVLGSHQRQNTGPATSQTAPEPRPVKNTGPNLQPNPVIKQHSFELSFQEKLQRWECNRHLESMELGEFELLEQAAEELSFSSNSSFVMKVRKTDSCPVPKSDKNVLKSKVTEGGRESEAPHNDEISEFGGKEVSVCFSAPSNPAYDKRSYQDEESFRDEVEEDEDEESDSVASNADGSTLIEDGRDGQRKVIFDDDDTWNDLDDTAVTVESSRVSPQEKAMLRKVAVSRAVEPDEGPENELAPASQLMTRLFPSLKPKAQSAPPPAPPQVQSRQLRERLAELEMEIERFKKENAALTKLRQENERRQEDLRKERLMFEQAKAEELANFEECKREENRKLQKERKLFEKHVSAARAIPDKKEREEIQSLKQQLSSQQEELKRRESRWASTHSRLRQQIDSLHQENGALRDEVQPLDSSWSRLRLNPTSSLSPDRSRNQGSSSSPLLSSAGRNSKDNGQIMKLLDSLKIRKPLRSVDECPVSFTETSLCCFQVEKVLAGGDRVIVFPNGTRKEVSADGLSAKVTFFNGDTKQITADQRVIYYYAEAQTTHITYPDGMEVLHFPNNQTEKHFSDGRKEITFPDQTVKNLFPDGREESVLTDGTIIQVNSDGTKEIHFNTGQKEIHTAEYKRREYPDGTVKTVYTDGRQETRYPTGRLRVKDKDGNIVLDNRV